jgi:uncharacterized surface protein with fasciclin (FAS1) repeats
MRRITTILLAGSLLAAVAVAPAAAREPGPTIVETAIAVNAATGEFSQLIAAASRAGLVETLNGNRQFTVFAPTDAAFADLYAALGVGGVGDIPVATLRAVLLHHVAPGERFSDDVVGASRIRTLNRDFVFPSTDGGASIDGATILAADIAASNGVIHVIDAVLVPGS